MASACVNNVSLPPSSSSSYGYLSPRISFSRECDFPSDKINGGSDTAVKCPDSDPDFIDFEFHLNDGSKLVPADELFSDGKLVPLHLAPVKPVTDPDPITESPFKPAVRREEGEEQQQQQRQLIGSGPDSFAVSPKAPTCSSRWRELLRLKRQQQQQAKADPGAKNPRSLKHFLNRGSRAVASSSDRSHSHPLLKDSEANEPLSIASSRLSLSSTSSSGHEADEVARLSLDENKPNREPILLNRNPPKVRVARARAGRSPVRRPAPAEAAPPRCASVDSPRMNASGRVVFQGLGRSSSSPSTFNGGPRIKHRGMERSYSANVRVTPVLNVPVCSLRGGSKSGSVFGFFSGSGPKGGGTGSGPSSGSKGKN